MTELTNLLIVDDDLTTRNMMGDMIRHLPVTIHQARDGQGALHLIKCMEIDVVISDLVMPRMSGLMLLHSMIELGIQVPFILTTGFGDKDSAIQALRLGVFDYLEKPIHEADLRSVVEEAIRVSHDQKALMTATGDEVSPSVQKIDPRTKNLVLRLKSYHKTQESQKLGDQQKATDVPFDHEWDTERDFFVSETLPLVEEALMKIDQFGTQGKQIFGQCLRLAQSIRFAAGALDILSIKETAWHCAIAAATIKLSSQDHEARGLEVLRRGFMQVKKQIEELIRADLLQAIEDMKTLQKNFKKSA